MTLPRPGHADLAGVLKYGHEDVRDALERASARHTAVFVAAGAVAKALLRELGIAVAGSVLEIGGEREGWEEAIDAARADRDTLGGIVEVRATRRLPRARLLRDPRGPARCAARGGADGDPGGEGGRGRRRLRARPRARLGGARRDRARPDDAAPTAPAGSRPAISNGEEIVVRAGDEAAADADAPARLGRPRDRRAGAGPRRAQRRRSGRGAGRRRRGGGRVGARAGRPREARRRRARRHARGARGLPGANPERNARARPSRRADRLHGRREVDARRRARGEARRGRSSTSTGEIEREEPIARIFETGGEAAFRLRESKHALEDVRDALERASARHTAVLVAAGAVAKSLLSELGIAVAGSVLEIGGEREGWEAAIDAARADRDTLGGVVEVRATRRLPRARLLRDARGPARRAARRRADGHPGREGRRGRRRLRARPRARLGGARRDRARPARAARTAPAGSRPASRTARRSSSAPAMKPLPTLMRPLDSVDLATGEPAQALVERSDVAAVEALAVVAEAAVAWELARAAREKLGGDALVDVLAAHARLPGAHRVDARARPSRRPDRLHGRRQVDARRGARGEARAAVRRRRRARSSARSRSRGSSRPAARRRSGCASRSSALDALGSTTPAVIALGGGAVGTDQITNGAARAAP